MSSLNSAEIGYPDLSTTSTDPATIASTDSNIPLLNPVPVVEGQPAVDGDVLVTSLEVCLPAVNDYRIRSCAWCFPNVDEYYFPSQLSIDWNVLHGGSISSSSLASAAATAAYERGIYETQGRNDRYRLRAPAPVVYVAPPDPALLTFFSSFPTRVVPGLHFLTLLQQRFSARIACIARAYNVLSRQQAGLLVVGLLALLVGLPNSSSQVADKTWAVVASVIAIVGLILTVVAACMQNRKRKAMLEAATFPGPVKVCAHTSDPQVVGAEGEQRSWHAQVNFKGQDAVIMADFEIHWRRCDEECLRARALPQLQEIVVHHAMPMPMQMQMPMGNVPHFPQAPR